MRKMIMEKYVPGIGVVAGSLMLKWDLLNSHVHNHPINIQPGDNVNVFINFESILRNLSMQKGLTNAVNFHKQKIVIELESAILNLMASYKMYFNKEKCKVKVYFYYTDLGDNTQEMTVYNKYYRTYYHNRYMQNPQFRAIGEVLHNIIIPEIELILSYVPGCYFLKSKTFDGSVIPQIVSTFSDSKNVIISGDIFDTLYLFNPNFLTIYIKRRFQHFKVISDIDAAVQSIVKDESPFDLTLFNSEMYYKLLLSIKGSKVRNIRSAKGFGYGKFINLLKNGIEENVVLKDFESIDSIIQLFPENYRNDIKQAFRCTSIDTQFTLLNDTDIAEIKSQIVDKVDVESLESLNNKRFLEFPINLSGLLS